MYIFSVWHRISAPWSPCHVLMCVEMSMLDIFMLYFVFPCGWLLILLLIDIEIDFSFIPLSWRQKPQGETLRSAIPENGQVDSTGEGVREPCLWCLCRLYLHPPLPKKQRLVLAGWANSKVGKLGVGDAAKEGAGSPWKEKERVVLVYACIEKEVEEEEEKRGGLKM